MPRKPQPLDWNEIARLAEIQCTQVEIAHVLGCSVDILQRRAPKEAGMELSEYMSKHAFGKRSSLRRWQWAVAEREGDGKARNKCTMLIWLGKQYLGQTDKVQEERHDNVNVKLETEVKELTKWLDDLEKKK